jgi:hypothetical protein
MWRIILPMDTLNKTLIDPDFLALGLGGTNMMSMLWTVAMGRRAVGVEMRGDPFLGVHWNIREDFYHQLGLIDKMMLERYGEEGVPRRGDGRIFSLADCFYSPYTSSGDIVADEIIDGFDSDQHIDRNHPRRRIHRRSVARRLAESGHHGARPAKATKST